MTRFVAGCFDTSGSYVYMADYDEGNKKISPYEIYDYKLGAETQDEAGLIELQNLYVYGSEVILANSYDHKKEQYELKALRYSHEERKVTETHNLVDGKSPLE